MFNAFSDNNWCIVGLPDGLTDTGCADACIYENEKVSTIANPRAGRLHVKVTYDWVPSRTSHQGVFG